MPAALPPATLVASLEGWSARHRVDAAQGFIGVAFSGGADSTALLLTAQARWPGRVMALHVHHGLQAAADEFERHCMAVCDGLGVPCLTRRVDASPAIGQSPEDAARGARYQALADMATDAGMAWVLLAQHLDDQAETVLLALSRGSGLPGLAAMPASFERHGMRFGRPWLDVPAQAMRTWLGSHVVPHVDDPMNSDRRFTRTRIRTELLPVWTSLFPHGRESLARVAAHAAQAQRLLMEVAETDLQAVGQPPRIAALQSLSRDRQANVLRHWLRREATVASTAQLEELQNQILACRTRGHHIEIKAGQGFVVRRGDHLACVASL